MSDEPASGLGDAELAASERPYPGDGISRAAISRSFRLE
jgi:hypothetical protein